MRIRRSIVAVIAASVFIIGMGASPSAAKTPKLKVKLLEFEVQPSLDYIAAGKTKVVAKNIGTEEHELVVVRGDDPTTLPTAADGSVDEEQLADGVFVDEIEGIKAGKKGSNTFKLSPDSYVMFCNIVDEEDDGTVVSHFAEGMYTVIEAS